MKNTLEGINNRLANIEVCISSLEYGLLEINQSEEQKKKKRILKDRDSLRDLCGNINHTHIRITETPEGKERERNSNLKNNG